MHTIELIKEIIKIVNMFNSGCVKLTEVSLVTLDCWGGIIAC